VYGRVKVVGMSVLEAEAAIKKHLSEMIENPQVQVTMYEKSEVTPTHTSQAQIPGESSAATFSRAPRLSEQPFETAVLQQLEKLRDEIGRISSENSSLRKRLDEIKSRETGR
jgi:regulator of replication initiation timing